MTTIPLKYIATVIPGQSPSGDAVEELVDGLPFIQGNAEFTVTSPIPTLQCDSAPKVARKGDVLISVRAPVGALNMADQSLGVGRGLAAIRAAGDTDSRFVRYSLMASVSLLRSVATGSTYEAVSAEQVGSLKVARLSQVEQRRVADFLDDRLSRIDSIISARNHQIDGLSGGYRSWQAEAFDAAELGNGSTTLRRFMISIEQGWSPQCASVPAEPGGHGVIKLGAVRSGDFRADENKAMSPGDEPDLRYRLNEGDLLVTRANTPTFVGDAAVVTGLGAVPLYLPDLVYRIRIVGSPQFLSFALRSPQNRQLVSTLARGTSQTMVKLRGEDVANFRVPELNADAQEALGIEDSRNRADVAAKAGQMQNAKALLTEYKQSLITAAVTGELDVTTASSEVPA